MDFDLNSTVTTGVSGQKPTKGLINEYVLFPYFQPYSDVLMETRTQSPRNPGWILCSVSSHFWLLGRLLLVHPAGLGWTGWHLEANYFSFIDNLEM